MHGTHRLPGRGLRPSLGGGRLLHHDQRRGRQHGRAERALLDTGPTLAAPASVRLPADQLPGGRHGLERRRGGLRDGDLVRQPGGLRGLRRSGRVVLPRPEPARSSGSPSAARAATTSPPPTAASSASATPRSSARSAASRSTSPWSGWPPRPAASATGWWRPTAGSSPSATPRSSARPAAIRSTSPSSGWRPRPSGLRLLAGGLRRRDLLLRRRPVPRLDRRPAAQPAGGRDGRHTQRARLLAGGGRRRDLLLRRRPVPRLDGRPVRSTARGRHGLPPHRRQGYWLVAQDGGIFTFDAPFFGSPA